MGPMMAYASFGNAARLVLLVKGSRRARFSKHYMPCTARRDDLAPSMYARRAGQPGISKPPAQLSPGRRPWQTLIYQDGPVGPRKAPHGAVTKGTGRWCCIEDDS